DRRLIDTPHCASLSRTRRGAHPPRRASKPRPTEPRAAMTFSTDRDLLVLEPNLFRDAAWSALTRVSATDATVAGATLTSASSDFLAAGVAPGMIALVDGAALEVVEVLSSTELSVSRLRDGASDPPIPPLPVTNADLRIATFG